MGCPPSRSSSTTTDDSDRAQHSTAVPAHERGEEHGLGHGLGHGQGQDRGGAQMWGGPLGGELPPRVEKCLRGAPEGPFPERGQGRTKEKSDATEVPRWREKSLRTFARCLPLLEKAPPPPAQG